MKLISLIAVGCVLRFAATVHGQTEVMPTHRDLEFAKAGEHRLLLDLYLPKEKGAQLLVWIHGGAWRRGSKNSMPLGALLKEGFAIASVDYRLTPVAKFPANVHDIKAAIRWLRAHAGKFGYDAQKVAIAGASAGGHLVALVGVSNGHPKLEGTIGAHGDQSSDVDVIVSFYGASNLTTILKQSTPHGLSVRVPALELLLGGHPDKHPEIAKLASPVFHVDAKDPPLLLIHGDQDPQMPINQSLELLGRYLGKKRKVGFEVIFGGRHGGREFYDEKRIALVKKFLDKHLN